MLAIYQLWFQVCHFQNILNILPLGPQTPLWYISPLRKNPVIDHKEVDELEPWSEAGTWAWGQETGGKSKEEANAKETGNTWQRKLPQQKGAVQEVKRNYFNKRRNNVTSKENNFKIKKQLNKLAVKLFQKTPISLYIKEALLQKMMCGIMEWYYLH